MDRKKYLQFLYPLIQKIKFIEDQASDKEAIEITKELIYYAVNFNLNQLDILLCEEFINGKKRDFDHPISYTNPHIIGKIWADDHDYPLEKGEIWNHGRRACHVSVRYRLDHNMRPINPYLNYGVKGRVVGLYGPNHAIDIAPMRMIENKAGKKTAHILGIIRQDDKKSALCGGFVKFLKNQSGSYPYNQSVILETQIEEFFEEMVSGSVELTPKYEAGLDKEVDLKIQSLEMTRHQKISDDEFSILYEQLKTNRKYVQVEKEDPDFVQKLRVFFYDSKEVYKGPVLSSMRNTNMSWMETRVSSNILDNQTWDQIKGDNIFDYDFKAGDDASDVLWHEITPDLIQKATGSHGSFFTYVLSMHLLNQSMNQKATRELKEQADELIQYFKKGSGIRSSNQNSKRVLF